MYTILWLIVIWNWHYKFLRNTSLLLLCYETVWELIGECIINLSSLHVSLMSVINCSIDVSLWQHWSCIGRMMIVSWKNDIIMDTVFYTHGDTLGITSIWWTQVNSLVCSSCTSIFLNIVNLMMTGYHYAARPLQVLLSTTLWSWHGTTPIYIMIAIIVSNL